MLQYLEKLPSPKAHHAALYYSSENFPSTCDDECSRLLGASRSASKSENSDHCKYSFPRLHWKEEYPIYRKFCFADRKPFHLISFSFLNQSFSSKPHKTQLVFVALSLVGVTSMACVPSIQSDRSLLGEGHRQDTRERRKSSLPIKAPRLFNNQSEVKEIHFFFPWIITTCAATPIMLGRVNSKASMYSVCARLRLNCFVVALSKDSPTKYFL